MTPRTARPSSAPRSAGLAGLIAEPISCEARHALRHPPRAALRLRRLRCTATGTWSASRRHRSPACSGSIARRCPSTRSPTARPTSPISSATTSPPSPIAATHDQLDVRLSARVGVEDDAPPADLSPDLAGLQQRDRRAAGRSTPTRRIISSPPSPRVALEPAITAYARDSVAGARRRCRRRRWTSASRSTATSPTTARRPTSTPRRSRPSSCKRGVCQDFVARHDRRPARRRHSGRLRHGLPAHHPAAGQAAARRRRRHACLGARLVRPACRLDRVRPDQRHARRRRPHHHRPWPRLCRHLADRRRAAHLAAATTTKQSVDVIRVE